MRIHSEPISEVDRDLYTVRVLRAWREKAPKARLGELLLAACAKRRPDSPASLLATIEDKALVELLESLPARPA